MRSEWAGWGRTRAAAAGGSAGAALQRNDAGGAPRRAGQPPAAAANENVRLRAPIGALRTVSRSRQQHSEAQPPARTQNGPSPQTSGTRPLGISAEGAPALNASADGTPAVHGARLRGTRRGASCRPEAGRRMAFPAQREASKSVSPFLSRRHPCWQPACTLHPTPCALQLEACALRPFTAEQVPQQSARAAPPVPTRAAAIAALRHPALSTRCAPCFHTRRRSPHSNIPRFECALKGYAGQLAPGARGRRPRPAGDGHGVAQARGGRDGDGWRKGRARWAGLHSCDAARGPSKAWGT